MSSPSKKPAAGATRELAAIMFSDVAGYTTIMGRDEGKAMRALAAHGELLRALLPRFNGRLIGEIGDGALSSFHSAVDAVGCAHEIQSQLKDSEFHIRIGIHVGDVVFTDNTVLGDGVNVASRIHQLAPPGGTCISQRVYEELRNKPEFQLEDLGEQSLKNVAQPIRVYALVPPGGAAPHPGWRSLLSKRRTALVLASAVGLIAALGYFLNGLRSGSIRVWAVQPRIRSLAVLPLENLSADPGQEYFADGMTEELITDLAKISALRVISRTSVMQFKGEHREPLPRIARYLNVDVIVEGSVLKVGDKVRITAQLIYAPADEHLWADAFESDSHDVLALQDELASAIAREINVKLTPQERERLTRAPAVDPRAYDAYLRGRYNWSKWTQEGRNQAREYFELAIKTDPRFALGYAGLADYYWQAADWDLPQAQAMPKARGLALKALRLDDSLAEAHTALGAVNQYFDFDPVASEKQLRRAIALNPGYAEAHHVYGLLLVAQARFEEAQTQMTEARQLSPLSPQLTADMGLALGWAGEPEQALEYCGKALQLDPGFFYSHFCFAINYGLLGERRNALAEAKRGSALEPSPLILAALGYEYARSGNRPEAQKVIEELDRLSHDSYVSPYYVATIYAALDEKQKALALLQGAYQQRSGALVFIGVDPRFDSLRSEPRFKQLLRQVSATT